MSEDAASHGDDALAAAREELARRENQDVLHVESEAEYDHSSQAEPPREVHIVDVRIPFMSLLVLAVKVTAAFGIAWMIYTVVARLIFG